MKACSNCHKELPTPLDEFGKANVVLCRDCFLAGVDQPDYARELQDAQLYCDSIVSDLQDQINIIDSLELHKEDFAMSPQDWQRNLETEQRELNRLQDRLFAAVDRVARIKDRMSGRAETVQRQIKAWGGKV